ncbi:flagellar biosynthesis regulator FlaF [Cohaesibacter celericrescens]|uniref:Flagellar protein FlaF n=1 Tax=Cohaesibacter celericrescens TaxID=2067669 RepID=A0A2N5XWH9_9HYPH|nr:flagellar biosynthesis regulator FlaF [Cohaesibacter celericrescens]PLW75447.1 flagellar protein FlaF [Cohaesibacter celericrescens]PLW78854.1 flagellar protein FlaF [Cohaesibacter celericrescens]
MYSQSAAKAYQNTGNQAGNPREREAALLIKAAAYLQRTKLETSTPDDLDYALTFNRKIWTMFVGELLDENHEMPKPLRENLVNLGLFTFNHTLEIMTDPQSKTVDSLININRNIAEGLRANN